MPAIQSDLAVSKKSDLLKSVSVALCGGGGIAAIELPRVARELRRHGANVYFYVTENCLRFVGAESLAWASDNPVVIQPTGGAEHICTADVVLVFPATADLFGKIAHGICSDGVTTLVQSAFGMKVPVIFCSTMHNSLAQSPIVEKNKETLASLPSVEFIAPRLEEGKEKAPTPEQIAAEVAHIVNRKKNFGGKKVPHVAVTLGGTRAMIDPVRCITNISTGSLGRKIALELYMRGVEVSALEGTVSEPLTALENLNVFRVPEYKQMSEKLSDFTTKNTDGIFHIAAVTDYLPSRTSQNKISSSQNKTTLELVRAEKLLSLKNLTNIRFRFACKLTSEHEKSGLQTARDYIEKHKLNGVFWNSVSGAFGNKEHKGIVLSKTNQSVMKETQLSGKNEIAAHMADLFLQSYLRGEK